MTASKLSNTVFNILFPPFNELQYVMVLAAIVAGMSAPKPGGHDTIAVATYCLAEGYFLIALILGIYVMKRETLSPLVKVGLVLPYYLFFFILAAFALSAQPDLSDTHSAFEIINYWIIATHLFLPCLRFVAVFAGRGVPLALAVKQFKDTQYKITGFACGVAVTALSVLFIRHFYDNAPTVVLLGFTYANFFYVLTRRYTDRYLTHTPLA